MDNEGYGVTQSGEMDAAARVQARGIGFERNGPCWTVKVLTLGHEVNSTSVRDML